MQYVEKYPRGFLYLSYSRVFSGERKKFWGCHVEVIKSIPKKIAANGRKQTTNKETISLGALRRVVIN